jgi:hypothetical protein
LELATALAIEQAARIGTSSMRAGYELLASAAILKASVNENRDGGQTKGNVLAPVDEVQRVMRYLGKGLALFDGQVVYVEMRDYRGAPLEFTPEQKKRIKRHRNLERVMNSAGNKKDRHRLSHANLDKLNGSENEADSDDEPVVIARPADPELRALIVNFFKTCEGACMRDSVFGLNIAGMIDHTEGEHKGHCSILYSLPGTIGIRSRERPAEDLRFRAPVTLQSLLDGTYKEFVRSSLGFRFELARKLVRAVCLLHSSGWLYKNIRAQSVMFFPEILAPRPGSVQWSVDTQLDVSEPILMGYIFSRPDDVIVRLPPPAQQPEDDLGDAWPGDEPRNPGKSKTTQHDASGYPPRRRPQYRGIYGHNPLETIGELPQETPQTNISGFKLDYYQHPAKHANPQRLYRHAYDVYSLGILLLEIGLWQELGIREDSIDEDIEDHYARRREICRKHIYALRWACGNTYAEVVLSCLMIDCSDDEAELASERELCAKLVADLEGCRA